MKPRIAPSYIIKMIENVKVPALPPCEALTQAFPVGPASRFAPAERVPVWCDRTGQRKGAALPLLAHADGDVNSDAFSPPLWQRGPAVISNQQPYGSAEKTKEVMACDGVLPSDRARGT